MGRPRRRLDDPPHRLHLQRTLQPSRLRKGTRPRGRQALRLGDGLSLRPVCDAPLQDARHRAGQDRRDRLQQHPRRQLRGRHAELDPGLRQDVREAHGLFPHALPPRVRRTHRRQRRGDRAFPRGLPSRCRGPLRGELRRTPYRALPPARPPLLHRALRQLPRRRPPVRTGHRRPDGRILVHRRSRRAPLRRHRQLAPRRDARPRVGPPLRRDGVLHREPRSRRTLAHHALPHQGTGRQGVRRRHQPHHLPPLHPPALARQQVRSRHDDGPLGHAPRPHPDVVAARGRLVPLPDALPVDAPGRQVRGRRPLLVRRGRSARRNRHEASRRL